MRKPTFCLILVLLAIAVPVRARQDEDETARKRRVEKAVSMITTAAAEAESLTIPENRLRIRAASAGALWSYDEARARKIYLQTADDIVAGFQEVVASDERESQRRYLFQQMRSTIINEVADRDPKFALDLLHRTRTAAEPHGEGTADPDLVLEAELAQRIAQRDPKRALEVARDTLDKGLYYPALNIALRVRSNDPDVAAEIVSLALDRVADAPLENNRDVMAFAVSVAQLYFRGDLDNAADGRQTTPIIPADRVQELIRLITRGVSNDEQGMKPYVLAWVAGNIDAIEKLAPEDGATLRGLLTTSDRANTSNRNSGAYLMTRYQNATVDDLVAASQKASGAERTQLISMAVGRSVQSGDFERARALADADPDPTHRKALLESLDRFAASRAVEAGRVAEAQAIIETLRSPQERVSSLLNLAQRVQSQGDSATAASLLQQVDNAVGEAPRDTYMFQARLQLAQAYTRVDPGRAFAIVEGSIDQLNRLLQASVVLSGFGCESISRNGEILLSQPSTLNSLVEMTGGTLGGLVPTDFDRVALAAGRFEKPEVRALVQIQVAGAVLAENKQ